jgi:hypothetical protein
MGSSSDSLIVRFRPATIRPGSRLRKLIFKPVFGPVIRDRRTSVGMATLAGVQIVAALLHVRTIGCPMLQGTGVPCPGCGLSRACGALLRGDLRAWVGLHLFAPLFIIAAGVLVVSILLPAGRREALANWMEAVEARLGVVPLTFTALTIYWMTRLFYSGGGYIALMRG